MTSVPNFLCAAALGPLLLTGLSDGKVPSIPTLVFSALAWAAVRFTIVLPRLLPDRPQATGRSWTNRLRLGLAIGADGIRDVGRDHRHDLVRRTAARAQPRLGAGGRLLTARGAEHSRPGATSSSALGGSLTVGWRLR